MNDQRPPSNCPPKDSHDDCPPPKQEDPPCPDPHDKPCPEPKACPKVPKQPCPPPEPDPCAEPPPAPPPECEAPPPPCDGKDPGQAASAPTTPAQQLDKLRRELDAGQRELQKFEPLKASLADLGLRIQSLEKTVDGQVTAAAAYTDFYRAMEVYRSEVECFIPTVRCQLDLTEKQKNCIRRAIAAVDARVRKAKADAEAQNAEVKRREARQKELEAAIAWARKWHEFFKSGLQAQLTKQRDDLKALKVLADPSKDQCEVWLYLSEMEAMLRSARTDADVDGEACHNDVLNLATFLHCWSPKCYASAYHHWIVAFNEAESAEKLGKSELAEAVKRATELDKLAKDAEAKRRDWILKELKTQDCCGTQSKCP